MGSARHLLTIALSLAGAVVVACALSWQGVLPVANAAEAPEPALGTAPHQRAGERVFLSREESAAAARAGLLPPNTRSYIATSGQLKHGDWHWKTEGVPPGPITVRADLDRQLISVFRGPHEIGTAVILYGAEGKETPRGKLRIRGKTRDHHSRTYDAPMPFSLWLREDGVALHGSNVAMGRATNGCIGVPVPFAEKLFAVARKGDVVEVIGSG